MTGVRLMPDEIAEHEFAHGFRGYDVEEVRSFLRSIETEMARLSSEVTELRSDSLKPGSRPGDLKILSREQLVELVGDEATSILADADLDAGKRRDASIEEGREILAEAQNAHEKVLGELASKRRDARRELAQLRAGIDQLRGSFDDIRAMLDTSMTAIDGAVDEARLAATDAAHIFDRSDRDDDAAAVRAHVAPPVRPAPDPTEAEAAEPEIEATVSEAAIEVSEMAAEPSVVEQEAPTVDAVPSVEATTLLRDAEHRVVYRREPSKPKTTDTDDLFTRIRMSREGAVSRAQEVLSSSAEQSPPDPAAVMPGVASTGGGRRDPAELFERLDETVAELAGEASTILKRVLADQLNEVLDAMRRGVAAGEHLVDFVPGEGVAAYGAALTDILAKASARGAGNDAGATDVSVVLETVSRDIGLAIRARVNSCLPEARSPDQLVRAIYREWRRERVDGVASDSVKTAYNIGVLSVIGESQVLRWAQRSDGCIYPDCADNALAEGVRLGEKFPTGHGTAPLGPGCRCLVVAEDR